MFNSVQSFVLLIIAMIILFQDGSHAACYQYDDEDSCKMDSLCAWIYGFCRDIGPIFPKGTNGCLPRDDL